MTTIGSEGNFKELSIFFTAKEITARKAVHPNIIGMFSVWSRRITLPEILKIVFPKKEGSFPTTIFQTATVDVQKSHSQPPGMFKTSL